MRKRKGSRSLACATALYIVVVYLAQSSDAQTASIDYTPPPSPPVWGDVNRDQRVGLEDLVELGAKWESSLSSFETTNTDLREQIDLRWSADVPPALTKLGWDNRPQTTSITDEKIRTKGQVDPSQPKAIGFGISFPSGQTTEKIGLSVFTIPSQNALQAAQFVALPGGYDDSNQFYNYPLEQAESTLSYIRSYEEELEFLGVDLSVEARYSVYTGSLKASSRRESYREGRTHKLLYKSTKSFGWYYLQQPEMHLTPGFVADLEVGADSLLTKYGTHYVYAEHRVGKLLIEVDFTTSKSRDRKSFKVQVEAGMNTVGSGFNIEAALETLRRNVSDVTNIRVRLHRVGGTPALELDDGRDWEGLAANLDANGQSLRDDVSKLISAWSADMDHYSKAAVDDFFCRPISDFYSSTPTLPWDKGKNLRDWYRRWAEFDDLSESMYGILTSPGNVLRNGIYAGNANNWSLDPGWRYENNSVRASDSSSRLRQTRIGMLTPWVSGASYDVQVSVDNYTKGVLYVGTNSSPQQAEIDTNGTFVVPVVADSHADGLVLTGSGFSGVIDGIRVTLQRDFSTPYRHFRLAGPANGNTVPEEKSSWLRYFADKRVEIAARKAELLEFGRALYDSGPTDNIVFDPSSADFEIANIAFPRFNLIFGDNASLGGCSPDIAVAGTSYGGYLQGELFAPGAEYRWMVVRVPGFPSGNCPLSATRPIRDLMVSPQNGNMNFGFWLDVNVQGSCCSALEEWQDNRYPGFGIGIIDRSVMPERLIAFAASGNNPDAFPLKSFGLQDAEYLISIREP